MSTVIANGEMETVRERELPDGSVLSFEYAPVGWPTKKGTPRQKEWRAYHLQRLGEKRERLPSVSTLLDAIIPKQALVRWAETKGIEGAVEAMRRGLLDPFADPLDAPNAVRANALGADAARDEGATRGLNVHAVIERYMTTGELPKLADHDEAHRGYVSAVARWLLETHIEPVVVEELVCDPDAGYAGRLDLVGRRGDLLSVVDFKTSEKGYIYDSAHIQAALYANAYQASGGDMPDGCIVVGFAADGSYREMPGACTPRAALVALEWAATLKPITSACESANRAQRQAA